MKKKLICKLNEKNNCLNDKKLSRHFLLYFKKGEEVLSAELMTLIGPSSIALTRG